MAPSCRSATLRTLPESDVEITIEHGAEPEPARRVLAPPSSRVPLPLRVIEEPIRFPVAPLISLLRWSQRRPCASSLSRTRGWNCRSPERGSLRLKPSRPPRRQPSPGRAPGWRSRDNGPRFSPRSPLVSRRTNARLAPVRLFVGASGEPSWSYKNKGYGAYRRLPLGGESLAWLRLELVADGQLRCSVKAHREERGSINAAADAPAFALRGEGAAVLFSKCLEQAETFATRKLHDSDEEASEQAWQSVDGLVGAALKATNGALAQAGAQFVTRRRRHGPMTCVVTAWRCRWRSTATTSARMHIERLPHEMEVAVGVREPQLAALARRRRIPVEGMTIHALAEVMASCAWPAIARFRDTRRPA